MNDEQLITPAPAADEAAKPAGRAKAPARSRKKADAAPADWPWLAQARFCPTGGIDADNATDYLSLDNVLAVGGSWLMPADKVAQGDWQGISALARQACSLSHHS